MKALAIALYNLLLPLALVLMLPRQWVKMRRRGGYGENWRERFARYDVATRERFREGTWWVHAVSVGEMLMALRLIAGLRASGVWTGPVVLTTTTSTGRALARERADGNTVVLWTPLDLPWSAARALRQIRPKRIILVEAEVWPNLLCWAWRRGVPVQVVNARLSARSERRYRAARALIAPIFGMLDHVCVQDEADRLRFAALGIDDSRITVTGAIKFDDEAGGGPSPGLEAARAVLARFPGIQGKRIILAASTHPREEAHIAKAWMELRDKFPDMALVAVPRHFERAGQAVQDLEALGLSPARRSVEASPDDEKADCLVVDSTGELRAWTELADVVVVGKSFVGHSGGQNPAEAVAAGRPTITGPRMDNFLPLVQGLVAAKGIRQLDEDAGLAGALTEILSDLPAARAMAESGSTVLARHRGATRRTLDVLAKI